MNRLAHYELLSKLASGGMAEIWVARRRVRGEHDMCVIKKLLPQHVEDEEFTRMFLEEGRLGASLVHPNIVRMFDFGSEAGTHYLAMEYLHGEDLRVVNRLHRSEGKTMPLGLALDVVARAGDGLHHAHELRGSDGLPLEIVHRDVSPHNVLLTFDGGVKVVDFGIAKSTSRRWETKHGTLKGKVPYMAPEQIKARKLDRRTDIYAMGVMLYEVLLGRRPYVLTAPGDFALMMAIARHDVRPPRELAPDIDPDLEAIILRGIAYDPKDRFQTMAEMSAVLDGYATSRRLERGPRRLAEYLASKFGARLEAWQAATQHDLAAHVIQIEEERAQSGLYDDGGGDGEKTFVDEGVSVVSSAATGALPAAPPNATSLVGSTSSAVAAVIEALGLTVVTLQGRIDESFEGAALGGSLSGTVLFDLKGVERVTSFGVREWLEMLKAASEQDDVDIWLARCSEAVVNQMSLIRTFIGDAKLVSFQAPFLCDDCGNAFSVTLDCERDAGWFLDAGAVGDGGGSATPRCARCGGATKLDDDPAFLSFAAPYAGRAVPENLRAVLETIGQADRLDLDAVDKVVTPDETRVRIHRPVDRSVRWKRVLDGIEGRLVIDFHGGPRVDAEGVANFARAVRSLGAEVTDIEIVECPAEIFFALGKGATGRPRVASVSFTGRCEACAATRVGIVSAAEVLAADEAGRTPRVPCRRCNAALRVDGSLRAIPLASDLGGFSSARLPVAPPADRASSSGDLPLAPSLSALRAGDRGTSGATSLTGAALATSIGALPVARAPDPSSPARGASPQRRSSALVAGALAVGLSLGVAALVILRPRDPGADRATESAAASSLAASAPEPPSSSADSADSAVDVATARLTPDGVELRAVVRGLATTGSDGDLARARAKAVGAAVSAIARALPDDVRAANEAASEARGGGDLEAAMYERYVRDVGAFAGPERTSVEASRDAPGQKGAPTLSVRYRIDRAAWDRAVAFYATTQTVSGLTLARALPSRRDGLVVVAASGARSSDVARGAVMVSVEGRPVTAHGGFDALAGARDHEHVTFVTGATSSTLKLK